MNKLTFKIIALVLILPFVCTPAFAKGKAKPRPTPARVEQDRVLAVSATSITVGNAKHSKTYTVSSQYMGGTTVYVNGQRATINDVHVGMAATVSSGLNGDTADTINVHEAPTTTPGKK